MREPSALEALSTGQAVRFRIGVHAGSALLLVLSRLGWLDESLFAEGVLIDWVAYQDGGRTADLIAAGRIDIGDGAQAQQTAGDPAVVMIDGCASGRPLLLVNSGFAQRQPRLVATVLQALEQTEVWTLAQPDKALELLALARECLDSTLSTARASQPAVFALR